MDPPTFQSPSNQPRNRGTTTYGSFRPPQRSPLDSSPQSTPRRSYLPVSTNSRKRPRITGPETRYETPFARDRVTNGSWTTLNPDLSRSIGAASPPPLINTQYRLAGGLDTPTNEAAEQFESLNCTSEGDFRRRWTSSSVDEAGGKRTIEIGALDRERNGRKRGEMPSAEVEESWGQYLYDVVGKVWEFCRTSAFRGFRAGGGTAYELTGSVPKPLEDQQSATPVPGGYPGDDFEELRDSDLDTRPTKRRQMSQGKGWVIVNPSTAFASGRRAFSSQPLQFNPPSHKRAQNRALYPRAPTSRHSRTTSTARLSSTSDVGSPNIGPQQSHSASFASPRSQDNSPRASRSPASAAVAADVQKYAAKRQREERQADASMKRLNQQLQMMIRQGKEALESKVEVHDEGFASSEDATNDEGDDNNEFTEAYENHHREW